MRKKILRGIAYLSLRYHRKILLIFIGLFAMAFLLTGRLRFDPDFLKLFPAEKGPIKLYMENLKEAGTFDLLFILMEKEKGVENLHFIDSGMRMAEGLKRLEVDGKGAFKNVRYQKVEAKDLEGGGKDPVHALRTTGRAMTMCSITTMLGFGSLVTARYQALSTMGWVTILGMGFCLITSLTLLPTLLILWKRRSSEP